MNHKYTISIIFCTLLVWGLWVFTAQHERGAIASAQQEVTVDETNNQDVSSDSAIKANARAILALLDELRSLQLDGGIFSDPLFTNLIDFSVTLAPEPKGRENPFAPFASSSSSRAGASKYQL